MASMTLSCSCSGACRSCRIVLLSSSSSMPVSFPALVGASRWIRGWSAAPSICFCMPGGAMASAPAEGMAGRAGKASKGSGAGWLGVVDGAGVAPLGAGGAALTGRGCLLAPGSPLPTEVGEVGGGVLLGVVLEGGAGEVGLVAGEVDEPVFAAAAGCPSDDPVEVGLMLLALMRRPSILLAMRAQAWFLSFWSYRWSWEKESMSPMRNCWMPCSLGCARTSMQVS